MKLITEELHDVRVIAEANESGGKSYFIEGPFLVGEKVNKNNRLYSNDILMREAKRYTKELIEQNRAFGELGHPSGPTINLERVSHMIKSLKQDGNVFIGRAKIMESPFGNIVSNLLKEGASLGVSSRGMGSLVAKNGIQEVQSDYYLATAADIVADPSAPGAFVQGIMEGKEWIYDNGVFREMDVYEQRNLINKAAGSKDKTLLEAQILKSWGKLIGGL